MPENYETRKLHAKLSTRGDAVELTLTMLHRGCIIHLADGPVDEQMTLIDRNICPRCRKDDLCHWDDELDEYKACRMAMLRIWRDEFPEESKEDVDDDACSYIGYCEKKYYFDGDGDQI